MHSKTNPLGSLEPPSPLDVAPLALLYHENSKLNDATQAEMVEALAEFSGDIDQLRRSITAEKTYPTSARIDLSRLAEPGLIRKSLADLLASRRSVRNFRPDPIAIVQLATLLETACGVTGRLSVNEETGLTQKLRAAPSGGALNPVETYLVALAIDGLPPGIYHYHPTARVLETVQLGSLRDELVPLVVTAPGPPFSTPALVVLAARWDRTLAKYHERGYRMLLLDAGHLAQNLLLVAAALGLGACPLGGFHDDRLAALCHLDPAVEPIVYAIMIGHPSN